jgi:hypothetical protein
MPRYREDGEQIDAIDAGNLAGNVLTTQSSVLGVARAGKS